jgi:hypothetical protein
LADAMMPRMAMNDLGLYVADGEEKRMAGVNK